MHWVCWIQHCDENHQDDFPADQDTPREGASSAPQGAELDESEEVPTEGVPSSPEVIELGKGPGWTPSLQGALSGQGDASGSAPGESGQGPPPVDDYDPDRSKGGKPVTVEVPSAAIGTSAGG